MIIVLSVALVCYILMVLISGAIPKAIRKLRMRHYFASEVFRSHKIQAAAVVSEFNELSAYIDEIRENGSFEIGTSNTGQNAHLASYLNTSTYGFRRDRNLADYASSNVHNASLQLVRSASGDPIKYLIKYFGIDATEETVTKVEALGESVSRLENAIQNLKQREESISREIAPPPFIVKFFVKEFREQVGLEIPPLGVPFPKYVFQYVSAGGNSSQVTEINLDTQTIDALIETLSTRVRFKNSAAGQRALMTATFRAFIKARDEFTCKICAISTAQEEHLLLEVDHIKPVSKGGLSIESNLQTLCWKCNRTKSNKE